jgi:hypothetical protein
MATANDGVSRFTASTSYAVPSFANGVSTDSINSAIEFSLTGLQANMDQTITTSIALPATKPMPFFGYFLFTPATPQTITLPTSWYPATRVLLNVNANSTISRPAGSTYSINGGASFTFTTPGIYLLVSIDSNQYGTAQIA